MNLPDPNPTLDRFYASVGRAMALAVHFEHNCYAVALLTGSFQELETHGIVALEDPRFAQSVFDDLQDNRRTLSSRIKAVFTTLPIEQFRHAVEEGRRARNKLVHELLKPHDVLIDHEVGRTMLIEELKPLVTKISVADGVMSQLFSVLSGNGPIEGTELSENTQRAEKWVMGVVSSGANSARASNNQSSA